MSFHDPISDMLTRIRNAKLSQHRYVDLNLSKMVLNISKVLKDQGYVENYLVDEKKRKIRVFLRFTDNREPAIQGLKRMSSPGLRMYVSSTDIPEVRSGMGIAIVSTPRGIVDGETARKLQVGGELLCLIW